MAKSPTFTTTLIRLIRKTICEMANEEFRSRDESGALYQAANEIGRRHVELVERARDAVEWQKQLERQEARHAR